MTSTRLSGVQLASKFRGISKGGEAGGVREGEDNKRHAFTALGWSRWVEPHL